MAQILNWGILVETTNVFCCFSSKVGKHPTEVDNIHNILATAAVRFNSNQLDHLFVLIQQVKCCKPHAGTITNLIAILTLISPRQVELFSRWFMHVIIID